MKVAELASESTYREAARVLQEWTAVKMSHQTVSSIVKRVGEAQSREDEGMVEELKESAALPEAKKVDGRPAPVYPVLYKNTCFDADRIIT